MTFYSYFKKAKRGFTLIELLIVIAIIGGLAGIFITTYPASQRRARDANRRSEIKQYQTALEAYANAHGGFYPPGTDDLSNVCSGDLGLTVCPDDTPAYEYLSDANGSFYVIWATLEQEDDAGDTQYFVVCSNGESGDGTTEPTTGCP